MTEAIVEIKLIDWNVAGAKFLKCSQCERSALKDDLNSQLQRLVKIHNPHFILLQEVVTYQTDAGSEDIIKVPKGYNYKASIAIDTKRQSHPSKWQPFYEEGGWPKGAYLAQGYGILWRKEIPHCAIWDLEDSEPGPDLQTEEVHLETGLYSGDRDTEPRLAVVAHFVLKAEKPPLDIFLVNLHLTTLKGEREGLPQKDSDGADIRLTQLKTVLHGVVSRYNEWRNRMLEASRRKPAPIWIIAGDFNCTPDSIEIKTLEKLNFLDVTPDKGTGTKASGLRPSDATITLDYIFAGPKYVAFDPYFAEKRIKANAKPIYDIRISDHFPLVATIPVCVPVS